jgi:hypothetical protein
MIIPTGSGAMQRSLPERNISHEPPSYIINVVCVIKLTQGKIAGIGWANVVGSKEETGNGVDARPSGGQNSARLCRLGWG